MMKSAVTAAFLTPDAAQIGNVVHLLAALAARETSNPKDQRLCLHENSKNGVRELYAASTGYIGFQAMIQSATGAASLERLCKQQTG